MKNFKFNSFQLAEPKEEENNIQKIQIFKAGVFSYWEPGDMVMSREVFAQMIVNFQNKVRGVDLAIDYCHNAYDKAAGWIKDIFMNEEGNELWGTVEWTKEAFEAIKDKHYRYISGEFSMEYENKSGMKCGPTLWGAALTNRPFLKEMEPVIMSEQEKIKMNEEVKKLSEKIATIEKQLSEKDAEIAKLKGEILASEKKAEEDKKTVSFNEMLKEGKVVEAQRESFMSGDVAKFAELSAPINLSAKGASTEPQTPSTENAEEKILALAEEKTKSGMSFSDAVKEALKENPELAKKYRS